MMGYLPLFLDVGETLCLVVGGGRTAHRKAAMLLAAGARVLAVSPKFITAFDELRECHGEAVQLRARPYDPGDLAGCRLVFAATGDTALNRAVAEGARHAGLWVNVVDEPALCSALCGAVLQRGPVQAAFSTGGACPALAVSLRDEFARGVPESVGEFAAALGAVRLWLMENCPDIALRRTVLRRLASPELRLRHAALTGDALVAALRGEAGALLTGR